MYSITRVCVCVLFLQNREPFVVPEVVAWPKVAEALNNFFHAHTGRGLTESNLDYLGRKLLGAGKSVNARVGIARALTRTTLCIITSFLCFFFFNSIVFYCQLAHYF